MGFKLDREDLYYIDSGELEFISENLAVADDTEIDDLEEKIEKHDELNPALFSENKLREEVRDKLVEIANKFVDYLKEDGVKIEIKDIVIVGSNASYNYTEDSDIDLHLLADESFDCSDKHLDIIYNAYRRLWADKFNITINGFDVELYVENKDNSNLKSNGIYSVLEDAWIKEPVKEEVPQIDEKEMEKAVSRYVAKYFKLLGEIENIDEDKAIEKIDNFIDELYMLRKMGIEKDGEYALSNLQFKEMRNLGYLDDLKNKKLELTSKKLSLNADEGKELKEARNVVKIGDEIPYNQAKSFYDRGYIDLVVSNDKGESREIPAWHKKEEQKEISRTKSKDGSVKIQGTKVDLKDFDELVDEIKKELGNEIKFTTKSPETNKTYYNEITEEDKERITGVAYKLFQVKNGKLYPPMIKNPGGVDTPIGKWINCGAEEFDEISASWGKPQAKDKDLAFRAGWHLGELPYAKQFESKKHSGYLSKPNFVWAECDYNATIDYQDRAMSYGFTKGGKFTNSAAGLPYIPKDGSYKYRTNPNPETIAWIITGEMKVNKVLSDEEVEKICKENNVPYLKRPGGEKTLKELGLSEDLSNKEEVKEGFIKKSKDAIKYIVKCKKCGCKLKYAEKTDFVSDPNEKISDNIYKWSCGRCGSQGQWEVKTIKENLGESYDTETLYTITAINRGMWGYTKDLGLYFINKADRDKYLDKIRNSRGNINNFTEYFPSEEKVPLNSDYEIDYNNLLDKDFCKEYGIKLITDYSQIDESVGS